MKDACETKSCCKDKKSIIIAVLALLCIGLTAALLSGGVCSKPVSPDAMKAAAVSSAVSAADEKLAPSAVIRLATIDGLGITASLSDVEGLAKSAGYACEKKQEREEQINWQCKHGSLDDTTMDITAINGQITQIKRRGSFTAENLPIIMNTIDDLKFRLNTRDGVRFNQSDNNMSLNIRAEIEGKREEADYRVSIRTTRDRETREEKLQYAYSANLSAQPPAPPQAAPESTSTPEASAPVKEDTAAKAPVEAAPAAVTEEAPIVLPEPAETPAATETAPAPEQPSAEEETPEAPAEEKSAE